MISLQFRFSILKRDFDEIELFFQNFRVYVESHGEKLNAKSVKRQGDGRIRGGA